jgi:hypothetical protein
MAYILHQKYGDAVFQISLHSHDISPSDFGISYHGPPPRKGDFIERIMLHRNNSPVGFDVVGSPFESLRDSTHVYYTIQSKAGFGDDIYSWNRERNSSVANGSMDSFLPKCLQTSIDLKIYLGIFNFR